MSKGKKRRTKLWLFLFLLFSIATTYYLVFETDVLALQKVAFNIDDRVSEKSIMKYAGLDYGESMVFMDQQQVADALVKHPLIKEVTVTKMLPNTLKIEAIYRYPFIAIEHAGVYLTLDDEMVVIDMSDSRPEGYCVDGLVFDNYVKGKEIRLPEKALLVNSVNMVKALNVLDDRYSISKEILYDNSDSGLGLVFEVDGGISVSIGDGDNAYSRVMQLQDALAQILEMNEPSVLVTSLDKNYVTLDLFRKVKKGN